MSAHGETESRNVERRFLENDYKTDPWRTIDRPAEFVIVDEEKAYRDLLKNKTKSKRQKVESVILGPVSDGRMTLAGTLLAIQAAAL